VSDTPVRAGESGLALPWKWLPWSLVASRIVLAPLVVVLAVRGHRRIVVACLAYALVADVADGMIARRLGVATPRLRQGDSAADVLFWSAALVCAFVAEPDAMWARAGWIAVVLAFEVAVNATSFARFGRAPASHAYLAKLWGLVMCASLVAIIGWGQLGALFWSTIVIGIAAGVDGVAILLLLPAWRSDVPSSWSAWQLRR